MNLLDNDFLLIRDFIYDRTGIFFAKNKKYIIERRLAKRMEDLGCLSIRDYYRLLISDSRGTEVNHLVNIVTTNETYFFRNIPQIQLLSEELLPKVIEQKTRTGSHTIKLWSAACSTGEEAYTLAINLLENIPDPTKWNIQVLASDINRNVLSAARQGSYGSRAVKDVHEYYLKKYFSSNGDGRFHVSNDIKKYVRFFYMNLIDEKQMSTIKGIDIIFCRNVLIYFDDKSRKKAVSLMYDSLNKEGHIFLGHSESMSRISTAFKICKFRNGIIYKKE